MFPELRAFDRLAFDTETTGLNPQGGDRVFGFSISLPNEQDFYWDIRETPRAVEWFNDQMKLYKGKIICHNLSFDYRMSKVTDINFDLTNAYDTAMMSCLVNEHEHTYSLDHLAKKYTKSHKKGDQLYKEMADLFGGRATKNVQMGKISKAPSSVVSPYAKGDTRSTLDLYDYMWGEIDKQDLHNILEFERKVTPHLIDAEIHGVRVDIDTAQKSVGKLTIIIKKIQKELNDIAGFPVNVNAPASIKKLFKPVWKNKKWWACDGTPLPETGAGNASLAADVLRTMSHPASFIILELRSLIKTRDTFLVGHILESSFGGRVYPTINQFKGEDGGTGTGRLSYQKPALQQIPDRNKEVAKIVKKVFLPDEGHFWVDADKASFEVRIFGHLIKTPEIINAYKKDPETDFHQFVSDITGLERNATYSGQPNAKQLNLSMIFNSGNGAIAEKMGMPWTWESFYPRGSTKEVTYKKAGVEAERIINLYHSKVTGVKELAEGCKETAEDRGYIFTREGRHLRFPNGYKSYSASGLLIQATAAEENKRSWMMINEALDEDSKLLLNTHDSYSMSIPEDVVEKNCRNVKNKVEEDRGLRIPLILEIQHAGKNWWDSKSSKRWM